MIATASRPNILTALSVSVERSIRDSSGADAMQVIVDSSPAEWLSQVQPLLRRAEAENNLLLGLSAQAVSDPTRFGQGLTLARVIDGESVVGAAMVNSYNLVLARQSESALEALAAYLADSHIVFPGVVGPDDVPERFLAHWSDLTGIAAILRQSQRIHECRRVEPLPDAAGCLRAPRAFEIPTVAEWRVAFHEAVGAAATDDDPAGAIRRMMERGEVVVWDAGDEIVSCAATVRRTPRGAVVAFVYTPPEQRGRGYATSCVAELTRSNLAAGAEFCCLYTDLANPTSNAIYARIGYRRVCNSAWWQVDR
jgi:hypothetical protein